MMTNSPMAPVSYQAKISADILARTMWGEARGEGSQGMAAVACVVMNRVAVATLHDGKYWWGNSVVSVCQAPYQFSCWNRTDENCKKVRAVDAADPQFSEALSIAGKAVAGTLPDSTHGATHYHTDDITPFWARGLTPTATIGHHVFYRIVNDAAA